MSDLEDDEVSDDVNLAQITEQSWKQISQQRCVHVFFKFAQLSFLFSASENITALKVF